MNDVQEASSIKSPEITQSAITDHLASNFSSQNVTQGESVCVCGGGTLTFSSCVGLGPASIVCRTKISGISSTPKIFEIFATQKYSHSVHLA